jgi:hypothetical protein
MTPMHIPEPFLGNLTKAKVIIVNHNPGAAESWQTFNFQSALSPTAIGTMAKFPLKARYSTWANQFVYLNPAFAILSPAGTKFWSARLAFVNAVVPEPIHWEQLGAVELWPAHSKAFTFGNPQNWCEYFCDYVLEPVLNSNADFIFFMRSAFPKLFRACACAKGIALQRFVPVNLWSSRNLDVWLGSYHGKTIIITVNNFAGYPGNHRDIALLRDELQNHRSVGRGM